MLGQLPSSNSVRVHHFLPGLGIALSAGGSAILSADGSAQWLSVPVGVGTAMVAHELRLLAGRNNPYWRGERFSFAQGAAAAVASLALGVRMTSRGRSTGTSCSQD